MFTLVVDETTSKHLEYFPVAQEFVTGKQGVHSVGLTSERTVFIVVVLLQREKRKLRNRVMSLVRTDRLIKQCIKLSLTEKMMPWPIEVKDAVLV